MVNCYRVFDTLVTVGQETLNQDIYSMPKHQSSIYEVLVRMKDDTKPITDLCESDVVELFRSYKYLPIKRVGTLFAVMTFFAAQDSAIQRFNGVCYERFEACGRDYLVLKQDTTSNDFIAAYVLNGTEAYAICKDGPAPIKIYEQLESLIRNTTDHYSNIYKFVKSCVTVSKGEGITICFNQGKPRYQLQRIDSSGFLCCRRLHDNVTFRILKDKKGRELLYLAFQACCKVYGKFIP